VAFELRYLGLGLLSRAEWYRSDSSQFFSMSLGQLLECLLMLLTQLNEGCGLVTRVGPGGSCCPFAVL
jgi:hypothetical protein